MRKTIVALAALSGTLSLSEFASAQSPAFWSSIFLPAKQADQISVCVAGIVYANAYLSMRLYGESMDFIYERDDFTLPYGQFLGIVIFQIDSRPFLLSAYSFDKTAESFKSTQQLLQLIPLKEDYTPIFNAIKAGTNFSIIFPNGSVYPVSLAGSGLALTQASMCWARNTTGPLQNNPFSVPMGASGTTQP